MIENFTFELGQRENNVKNYPYLGGMFSGVLKNGRPLNGKLDKATVAYKRDFTGLVKDGALCDEGYTRFQRKNIITPFQNLLNIVDAPNDEIRKFVLDGYDDYTKLTTEEKYDISNDNVRRVFDSYFAKNLLTNVMRDNASKIRKLSDNILKTQSKILAGTAMLSDWQAACDGTYIGEDTRLQQLVTQMERVRDGIATLDLEQSQKDLLVDLYVRHYLNYLMRDTDVYKSDHPTGVLKSSSNPLYFKRGRLDGPFRENADSRHMGIIRNIDKAPTDLRFVDIPKKKKGIEPSLYTRCPDRLNMADPNSAIDKDSDSWLTYNFSRCIMPFVNGLSGSMLIEMQSMLYIKEFLKKKPDSDFLNSPELLNDYFRSIAGLYVLVDGGHSLFEIKSSFDQTWIKTAFIQTFEGKKWGNIGQSIYEDKRAFDTAFKYTKLFHKTIQGQTEIHKQLNELSNSTEKVISPSMAKKTFDSSPEKHTGISINGKSLRPKPHTIPAQFLEKTLLTMRQGEPCENNARSKSLR